MGLRGLLSQRRYRRLSLALVAALAVHLGLGLSGNWGILLSSAPSNQDRVLTLSLENTTYEGLKETSVEEQDTLNDAKLGKPVETQKKVTFSDEAKKISQRLDSSSEASTETIAHEPIAKMVGLDKALEQREKSAKAKPAKAQAQKKQTEVFQTLSELIVAQNMSEIKVFQPPLKVERDQPSDTQHSKEINNQELEMFDNKVAQWSSNILDHLESTESQIWQQGDYQYNATFEKQVAKNDMDTDEVLIEIATNRDGKKLTTSLRLKKMAFSNFAQFVNQWDSAVSIHDDEVNGRFHSNTRLNLLATRNVSPVFNGKVTTASYFIDIKGDKTKKDIFLAGLETGVKRIAMPKPQLLFKQIQSNSSINSRIIEQDSRIIFTRDGHYSLQPLRQLGVMQPYKIGDRPLYILAAPGVSLYLSGTVNGLVAVYSPKKLLIEGNLEYLSTENIDQGGDFLGLISGRSVVVANRKAVPKGDLNIHAAIYAKKRFRVTQLFGRPLGTLNIFGSVSVGAITATEPRYATNIVFDKRLENLRPPGFPVTDRYELVAKKNHWKLEEDPFFDPIAETDDIAEDEFSIKSELINNNTRHPLPGDMTL